MQASTSSPQPYTSAQFDIELTRAINEGIFSINLNQAQAEQLYLPFRDQDQKRCFFRYGYNAQGQQHTDFFVLTEVDKVTFPTQPIGHRKFAIKVKPNCPGEIFIDEVDGNNNSLHAFSSLQEILNDLSRFGYLIAIPTAPVSTPERRPPSSTHTTAPKKPRASPSLLFQGHSQQATSNSGTPHL